jgi:hypothetical protein
VQTPNGWVSEPVYVLTRDSAWRIGFDGVRETLSSAKKLETVAVRDRILKRAKQDKLFVQLL